MTGRTWKRLGFLVACAAAAACSAPQQPAQVAPDTGLAGTCSDRDAPAHAVLLVPPGEPVPSDLAARLHAWQVEGRLSDVVLVEKRGFKDGAGYTPGFEMFATLDFPDEAAWRHWEEGPRTQLGNGVIVTRVDVLLDRRSRKSAPARPVFHVSQYETLVDAEAYEDYTAAYVEPNMANQMFSGIVHRYAMYLEREPSGGMAHAKAFLVAEYADQPAYARRGQVKAAYEAALHATHPEWTRIDAIKHSLRRAFAKTEATPVMLQAPASP